MPQRKSHDMYVAQSSPESSAAMQSANRSGILKSFYDQPPTLWCRARPCFSHFAECRAVHMACTNRCHQRCAERRSGWLYELIGKPRQLGSATKPPWRFHIGQHHSDERQDRASCILFIRITRYASSSHTKCW